MIMRILVCGDRNWTRKDTIKRILRHYRRNTEAIIEGEAKGADTLAREVAQELNIPILSFPAQWQRYGKAAGPIRNKQMLDEGKPDIVIAFHDCVWDSKGTKNTLEQAEKKLIPIFLFTSRDFS